MLCEKCKVNEIFHKRKMLCTFCYKVDRKEKWILNDKVRMMDPSFLKNRREYKASYFQNNKQRLSSIHSKYERNRLNYDINFFLRKTLRRRLTEAIKNNQKVGSAVSDLGCSIDELKKYLESKFSNGMTWNNYGVKGWHIDHIKPLCSFDLKDEVQLKEACHYTNLQPLWWEDNLRKGCKNG